MNAVREQDGRSRRRPRSETVVLFTVAHQEFAIAADSVQEIRSTDALAGAANEIEQPALSKVGHTMEHGRRAYYVVNAGVHFGLPVSRPALVLILRQSRVAVLIDRIERMTEISAVYSLPMAFSGEERRWYRGLAYLDDVVIPVVQPDGFLTAEELETLDRAANAQASPRDLEGAIPA
jgi:chemotaxis signal transduction protein